MPVQGEAAGPDSGRRHCDLWTTPGSLPGRGLLPIGAGQPAGGAFEGGDGGVGEVVRVRHQPFLPGGLGRGPRCQCARNGGGVQADGGEPAGGDGDERGRRPGWPAGGDDGPDLAATCSTAAPTLRIPPASWWGRGAR